MMLGRWSWEKESEMGLLSSPKLAPKKGALELPILVKFLGLRARVDEGGTTRFRALEYALVVKILQ